MNRYRTVRGFLVALAALILISATAAPPASAAPAASPSGSPVTAVPTRVFAAPSVPLPGRAWSLTYRSTSATGEVNVVGATLLLPAGPWLGRGERPLVTQAVGTHGLGDQCAPSAALATGTEVELLPMGQSLARGWAVVVSEYGGLGTPGPHTYNVSSTEGHAVFDAACPELGLRDRLTPAGQALYDDVVDDCVAEINEEGRPFTADELTGGSDPFGSGAAAQRVEENRVGGSAPAAPALDYHGGADTLVAVSQGRGMRADRCGQGATVRYAELPLTGHVAGALPGGPGAVQWLTARFAGVPAPSNC